MNSKIIDYKNKTYGNWHIVSMDGVTKNRHRLWNVVNTKTGEKRLMSSSSILRMKKRTEKAKPKKST